MKDTFVERLTMLKRRQAAALQDARPRHPARATTNMKVAATREGGEVA